MDSRVKCEEPPFQFLPIIAESYNRFHRREKDQFLSVAFASGAELESHVEVAKLLFPQHDLTNIELPLHEVMKILNVMLAKR
ncbi:MAG: hypothetical protein A3D65_06440 [Candidatus Lloydbacteria bacterium RIFCSPHIGHO2_02_FULL_50_13]|uniref:Uncharacterized protein n=1 Tax=Candidatus Lloydbacteria bacterium RIFCSPHIGHO2_02_FULL_50_13 TaxID=1798661 RepID=A0A1G2D1R8_9BACT|nr:MAG: hypothetical protein A3D65_06440 [Candidatus Lloydbacteria bacterium RIFCSPHIGHO2_02_FULL_50_13]